MNFREAYHQVRIKERDELAFNYLLGYYQFQVMLFGLQGAPTMFLQLINEVLH